jgi:PITH domain
MADLLDSIEWRAVECLNANPAHGVENALKQVLSAACMPKCQLHITGSQDHQLCIGSVMIHVRTVIATAIQRTLNDDGSSSQQGYRDDMGIVLQSDTDEQLLIQIPFQQGELLMTDCAAQRMVACPWPA